MAHLHKTLASNVRIMSLGDPFTNRYDLVVEVLKDGEWTYFSGFNTFTNDYAFSSANDSAREAMVQFPLPVDTSTKKVGTWEKGLLKFREYEAYRHEYAYLCPPTEAYIAYEKGHDGDDTHAYGATAAEAIENLRDLIED
jgi:hypothetical protein